MQRLLEQTPILDYHHPSIQNLIEQRKWRDLDEVNKVRNIYNFVVMKFNLAITREIRYRHLKS